LFPLLSLGITVLAVASIRYIGLRLHAVGCKYLCLLKLWTHFWKKENFLSDRPFIFQKKNVYVQKEICPFHVANMLITCICFRSLKNVCFR
jgi:hypothetical protein